MEGGRERVRGRGREGGKERVGGREGGGVGGGREGGKGWRLGEGGGKVLKITKFKVFKILLSQIPLLKIVKMLISSCLTLNTYIGGGVQYLAMLQSYF